MIVTGNNSSVDGYYTSDDELEQDRKGEMIYIDMRSAVNNQLPASPVEVKPDAQIQCAVLFTADENFDGCAEAMKIASEKIVAEEKIVNYEYICRELINKGLDLRDCPRTMCRRFYGLFWPLFNFCNLGGYIHLSILPPK